MQGKRKEAAAVLEQYEKHKTLLLRAGDLLRDEAEHPEQRPEASRGGGGLLLDIGQDNLGLYWLDQALLRDPENQPAHKALAAYYERKGRRDEAAAHRRHLVAETSRQDKETRSQGDKET